MAIIDKNQRIIEYLLQCPQFKNNPTYFNFANEKDNIKQIIADADDNNSFRKFIDGSIQKQATFTIIDYRSVNFNPLVKAIGVENENVAEMFDVQKIVDWVQDQNEIGNFPDFGEDCDVERIEALSNSPNFNGVNTSQNPPLAQYSIIIRVTYIDNSKAIWR